MPADTTPSVYVFEIPTAVEASSLVEPEVATLSATESARSETSHWDTARGHLNQAGISLTKSRGTGQPAWQLEFPTDDEADLIGLDSRATSVPREFSLLLLATRGGERLIAVAKVTTVRATYDVVDPDGRVIGTLRDETIEARLLAEPMTDGDPRPSVDARRRVTLEHHTDGDPQARKVIRRRLKNLRSKASKLDAGTGLLGPPLQPPQRRRLGGLVDTYLQDQIGAISRGDLSLRRGQDVVYPTRVAVRRLRSTLHVFSGLFDAEATRRLDGELAWFASVLGAVRNCDVVAARIAAQLDGLGEQAPGGVAAAADVGIADQRTPAAQALSTAMNGRRYAALVSHLEQWRWDPPLTGEAARPRKDVDRYLSRAATKLRRRLRAAAKRSSADDDVHRARKAAKRLRYAAELAEPELGRKAGRQLKNARQWQDVLGEFQDSRLATDQLARLAHEPGVTPDAVFAYGILTAGEWRRQAQTRASIRSQGRS